MTDKEPSRKPGAPKGNRNAERHGLRGFLVLGRLPKGAAYIERYARAFRDALVEAIGGQPTVLQEHLVDAAVRSEEAALLMKRWLRLEAGDEPQGEGEAPKSAMSLSDRLAVLDRIQNATEARDKYLRRLGLKESPTADTGDLWAALASTPPDATEQSPGPPTGDDVASRATESGFPLAGEPEGADDPADIDDIDDTNPADGSDDDDHDVADTGVESGFPSGDGPGADEADDDYDVADDVAAGEPEGANSDQPADDRGKLLSSGADEPSQTPQGDDDHDDDDHDDIGDIDVADDIDDPEGLR